MYTVENADRQDQIDKALRNGPLVYELFSVLIHRGSAMGGHYYGYVRVSIPYSERFPYFFQTQQANPEISQNQDFFFG